jgi:hypothetical protein
MSRARLPLSSGPIAVVMAFVIGLIATAAVGILLVDGRDDRPDFLFVGVGAVGAACAVVGVVCRSRVRALLAGGVGSMMAAALVSGWWAWPMWLAWLWVLLAVPYLAGFGTSILLTDAFLLGVRHSPFAAALIGAVIVVIVGAGAAFVGPRLIGGPCFGTSMEQAAASYSYVQDPSSGGLRLSLDAQFKTAGQDAELLGAAYRGAAVYDDDYTAALKDRLCFPAAVRSQVESLTTAVDGRARVHRLLADDPFNTDLLAQLRSSQETVTVATVELRRALGLPPLSEPSSRAAPTPTPASPSAAPVAVPSSR